MSMLKRALEDSTNGQTGDELSIVMKGPLAENYTQALDLAYAKTDPATGEPIGQAALESAQQESTMMQQLLKRVVPETEAPEEFMTVYGVNKDSVSETEIVEVAQMLANQETSPDQMIVVMDATLPGPNGDQSSPPTERFINLAAAMESICNANGVKIYSSLAEFARSK